MTVVVRHPMVLDHAGRHLHQAHRVRVVRAVIAGHVEHTEHVAARIEDRRRRAGEELVGVHEVLVGMNDDGLLGDEGRAHAVGALVRLGPVDARGQRDLRRPLHEIFMADGVQHGAFGIDEHHHALGGQDLLQQQLHHRHGVHVQPVVALARNDEVRARARAVVRADAAQAQRSTTLMRLADRFNVRRVGRQQYAGRRVPERKLLLAFAKRARRGVGRTRRGHRSPFNRLSRMSPLFSSAKTPRGTPAVILRRAARRFEVTITPHLQQVTVAARGVHRLHIAS